MTWIERILHLNLDSSVYRFDTAGFCFQTGRSKPSETRIVLQCCLNYTFTSLHETKLVVCQSMLDACRVLGYAKQIKQASCHRIHQPAWGWRPPKFFQSCSQFFQIAADVCDSTPRKPLYCLSEVQEVSSFSTDQCSLLQGHFSWSCHVNNLHKICMNLEKIREFNFLYQYTWSNIGLCGLAIFNCIKTSLVMVPQCEDGFHPSPLRAPASPCCLCYPLLQ